jgi:hypothetical protein
MAHDLVVASIPNNIDDAGALRQFVVNLFYGWGYNAYRQENKDRADDLLVRQEVSHWLAQARAEVGRQESEFRREHLPPPTREKPFADRTAVAQAQAYQRLSQAIEAIELTVRSAALPEDDRTWRRHRDEGDTLKRLMDQDIAIAEAAALVLQEVGAQPALDLTRPLASLQALSGALAQRRAMLSIFG